MGDYTFDNLTVDIDDFDTVVCDSHFKESAPHIKKLGYREVREYILNHYTQENILYVVTGSPLFFSAGILIAKRLPRDKVRLISNTSSKDYLLEKLLISEMEVESLSLHGRDSIDLRRFLSSRYTFVLCDKESIDRLKEATRYLTPEDIEVTIGYKLGYSDEVIEQINLFDYSWRAFDLTQPFVILIERLYKPLAVVSEDSAFATERGMITKQYKRHLSLQHLDLEPNQLLWDVGAGSGSCAIEAYKRYRVRTILFEKQPQRCDYIRQNLTTHKVCDTLLLEGDAQRLFETVEGVPDRIFVGGGGEQVIARLPYLYERLSDSGVMLINAITLKNLTQMISVLNQAQIEYRVISLSLTTYKGALDLIEPERQLFQIRVVK